MEPIPEFCSCVTPLLPQPSGSSTRWTRSVCERGGLSLFCFPRVSRRVKRFAKQRRTGGKRAFQERQAHSAIDGRSRDEDDADNRCAARRGEAHARRKGRTREIGQGQTAKHESSLHGCRAENLRLQKFHPREPALSRQIVRRDSALGAQLLCRPGDRAALRAGAGQFVPLGRREPSPPAIVVAHAISPAHRMDERRRGRNSLCVGARYRAKTRAVSMRQGGRDE